MQPFTRIFGILLVLWAYWALPPVHAQDPCNNIWYCTPNGTGTGSQASPASVQTAVANALSSNAFNIRLSIGTHVLDQVLTLPSGVTIEGGFDPITWQKATNGQTLLQRSRQNVQLNPRRLVGVEAIGESFFSLRDLNIEVLSADTLVNGFGVSVYGVYLNGCSDYFLSRVNVVAGDATKGSDGAIAVQGANGAPGVAGGDGCRQCDSIPNSRFNSRGGAGGNSWSAGLVAGGRGGQGTLRGNNSGRVLTIEGAIFGSQNICPPSPFPPTRAQAGQAGGAVAPVPPGLGGSEAPVDKDFIIDYGCNISAGDAIQIGIDAADFFLDCPNNNIQFWGRAGENGFNGGPGFNGNPGIPAFTGGFFIPGDGQSGTRGEHGSGGGGGGGGGGSFVNIPRLNSLLGGPISSPGPDNASPGGGGGGGGEGGQGGEGGGGGGGGGASFGLFIWANGQNAEIRDCQFSSGAAGIGGLGRVGAAGGSGGTGGAGGFHCTNINNNCAAGCEGGRGGAGGNGGNGGRGGDGGNGAAGVSQAIYQNFSGLPVTPVNVRVPFETPFIVQNTGCSFSDVRFVVPNSDPAITYEWNFGADATPINAFGDTVITRFTQVGNKTIVLTQNGIPFRYTYFVNINATGFQPEIVLAPGQNDSVCLNQTVTLNGLVVPNNNSVVETEWITRGPGLPGTITAGGPTYTYTTPQLPQLATYRVYFRVRTTCCGWSVQDSLDLSVIPTLNPGLSLIAPVTETCPGNPIILQAFPAQQGPLPPTYIWRRNNVVEATNFNPTYTPPVLNNGDQIDVEMVPNYICSTPPSVRSQPITFTVFPQPTVSCNPVADRRLGNPSTLTANITGGTPPYSYTWDLGNGFTSTGNSTTGVLSDLVTYGGPGTYTVTLIITDVNGCNDTCTTTATIQNFTVLTGDFTGNPQEGCDQLTVTFTGTGNATNFAWNFGDNTTGTGSPVTHTYTAGQEFYTVSMVASDNLGSNPPVVKVNYIRVLPSPVAAIEVLGSRLCANEPVVLSAAGGGDYVYNWDLGNGQTATTPVVFGFYTEGVYNVTLTVTNAQGICSDVTTLPITVRGQPTADFDVIPTSPGPPPNVNNCVPATVFFQNNSTITSGNIGSYFWQFGDMDTTSVREPTFTFNEQGRYRVTLIAFGDFGCRDTAIKDVEIRPTPTARFTATNPVMEQPNNFTGFINNSIEEPGSTHEWTFVGGDPPNSFQRDPGIITYPLLRRCYPVKLVVTDPQGCRDSTLDSVCVRPIQRIYVPNVFSPNGDFINDLFEIYNEGYEYNITIFDRWGREVFRGNNTQIWNGRINNTGEEVPEGAYAWRLTAFNYTTGSFNLAGTVTVLR